MTKPTKPADLKKYSSNKDINKLVIKLVRSGWKYINRKKHGALVTPSGEKLTVPSSPSDTRAYKNFTSQIQKATCREK